MFKIAVLISGGGTNLQALIDGIHGGYLNCIIDSVISDTRDAYGLNRAEENGIKTYVLDRKTYKDNISAEILKLTLGKVDLIVMAGFLSIVKGNILKEFKNRIINIHPSLIPAFCGSGMYGIKVHEKALEYGVKISGCTVHFVDEGTDTGSIIIQRPTVVFPEDTAEILQKRVMIEEHKALPEAVKLLSEGKLRVENRRVYIEDTSF